MYLRKLVGMFFGLLIATPMFAQVTITRGVEMSVDAAHDGRLAIDLRGDIWVVPGSGGDARQLTQDRSSEQRPRWSPDGNRLIYQAAASGQQGIWLFDLRIGEAQFLGSGTGFDVHPEWHPGGENIVYASDIDGNGFDLWEMDIRTGLRWRTSFRNGDETEPAWSDDGRDLVYVHHDGEFWSLILRRHSQAEEVLLRSADKLTAPSWRPDGSLITYNRTVDNIVSIDMVILSAPRLHRRYVSNEQIVASAVSWLDRDRMVYSANGEIRQRLFGAWRSKPLHFRATIPARVEPRRQRTRVALGWPEEPSGGFVVHAARLFDGVTTGYQYDKDLTIDGGRIVSVAAHSEHRAAIVIDMGDLTILPGFIDADARLPGRLVPGHGPDLLAMGITTVVASYDDAERLNELWAGKETPGPRLLQSEQFSIGGSSRPELDLTAAVVSSRSMGMVTGEALATQFRAMKIAGLSAEQTLRAIGVNAAAAMRADPYLGRLADGSAADLVFVDGDPLENVNDALNVVAMVRNGRFYSVSGLFDRAKRAESVE